VKILFISKKLPAIPITGENVRRYYLLKNLSLNNEITFVSFPQKSKQILPIKHLKAITVKSDNRKPEIFHRVLSPLPYYISRFTSINMNRKIKELLKYNRFDVIICDQIILIKNIPVQYRIPVILDNHDAYSLLHKQKAQYLPFPFNFYSIMQYIKSRNLERKISEKIKNWILVSREDKKYYNSFVNIKSKIIPNGVSILEEYAFDNNIRKPYLLFTGRMDYFQNIISMTRFIKNVFPLIQKALPEIKLIIAGSNPPKKLINIANRNKNIILTGYVKNMEKYFLKSEIFISPIITGTGIKNKVLQAMSYKLPVVSTTMGKSGIEARDGKEILIADDDKEFANKVLMLHYDKKLRIEIAARAFQLVSMKYQWRKITHNYEEVIKDIIKSMVFETP